MLTRRRTGVAALYLSAVGASALRAAGDEERPVQAATAAAMVMMHVAWGFGFFVGVAAAAAGERRTVR